MAVELVGELGLGFAVETGLLLGIDGTFGAGSAGSGLLGFELVEGVAQLVEVDGGYVEISEGFGVLGAFVEDEAAEAHEVDVGLAVDDENRLFWHLTLADAIALATANDFMGSAYLTAFDEEMRAVQVEINGVPAAAYDAQMHETLGHMVRFQVDWGEIFGHHAGYQARMTELEALREEFVEVAVARIVTECLA